MPWLTIHKNPRATAAAGYNYPMVQIMVVLSFSVSNPGKISMIL